MVIVLIIISLISMIVFKVLSEINWWFSTQYKVYKILTMLSLFALIASFIFGCFHGFVKYPKTERSASRCYNCC